ncbi:MAG: VanW family protein [Cyanobacteria bacterium J06635_11]
MALSDFLQDGIRSAKRSLRIGMKFAGDLRQGYPFTYATHQAPLTFHQYPYLWHESTTPIPDRGSPEVRTNRIQNLQLATQKIHQLQLDPGKVFSFCNRVGDANLRNGYRAGAVYIGGQLKTGAGGGLCLIATNLFHLFLNAGCEILERHAHSIDAYGRDRFYELGQDAAIAYGYKDLIIRNQTHIPLVLKLEILPKSGKVVSSILGQSPSPLAVTVESFVIQELKSPLPNGVSGWKVETKRTVQPRTTLASVQQTQFASSEYCTTSLYKPCEDNRVKHTAKQKVPASVSS